MSRKRRNKPPERKKKSIILRVFGVIFCILILDLLFQPRGTEFKTNNPTETALMRARKSENEEKQNYTQKITWVPITSISPVLIRAIIKSEDASFYSHSGFDWYEMYASLNQAITEFRFPRGASTITQQLAKNLYLSESKNPLRKLREAVITKHLENNLGKKRILELYLNVIEWGPGIFGAEAASQYYFKKSAANLSIDEAAKLTAIIPNPNVTYNPTLNPKRVEKRMRRIRNSMMHSNPEHIAIERMK